MNAKQHLFRLRTLRDNIKKCEEGILDIRTQMQGVNAIRYDKVVVQTSATDKMADLMDRLIKAEDKLKEMKAYYWLQVVQTQAEIYAMPKEIHRMILSEYFINNKTIRSIAYDHSYEETYIYNQYEQALKVFSRIHGENEKDVEKC